MEVILCLQELEKEQEKETIYMKKWKHSELLKLVDKVELPWCMDKWTNPQEQELESV